jgi:hypothetical protein
MKTRHNPESDPQTRSLMPQPLGYEDNGEEDRVMDVKMTKVT